MLSNKNAREKRDDLSYPSRRVGKKSRGEANEWKAEERMLEKKTTRRTRLSTVTVLSVFVGNRSSRELVQRFRQLLFLRGTNYPAV